DFGISKHLENVDSPADQTQTAMRLMTPAYAAPEQIRGDPVGTSADIYALGVILYELLCGRLPFDLARRTPGQIEATILDQAPSARRPSRGRRRPPRIAGVRPQTRGRPNQWPSSTRPVSTPRRPRPAPSGRTSTCSA